MDGILESRSSGIGCAVIRSDGSEMRMGNDSDAVALPGTDDGENCDDGDDGNGNGKTVSDSGNLLLLLRRLDFHHPRRLERVKILEHGRAAPEDGAEEGDAEDEDVETGESDCSGSVADDRKRKPRQQQ